MAKKVMKIPAALPVTLPVVVFLILTKKINRYLFIYW